MSPLLKEVATTCRKSSFLCPSRVPRANLKFCISRKLWSFHVARGYEARAAMQALANGSALLNPTFSNMRLVHPKNSLPSTNLLYKRKRNRQKSSPGHNMFVNVCLPTLHVRGGLSNPSDLAPEHQSPPLPLRGFGPSLQLVFNRLPRTRQERPFVIRRATTPILHHGEAGPPSWLSTVTKQVRKNNKQNRQWKKIGNGTVCQFKK